MRRIAVEARPNWKKTVEDLGFRFHTIPNGDLDPTYWDETAAYQFSSEEIDHLDDATTELYARCIDAVEFAVNNTDVLRQLRIPDLFHHAIRKSWDNRDLDLYGRFDLTLDPKTGTPKMLEFNADTPTSLFEASVVQWHWLQDVRGNLELDQFNSIHERLEDSFRKLKEHRIGNKRMFFASVRDHEEDQVTVDYLRDVAMQAGLNTNYIAIEDIGWNGVQFTDLAENPIEAIFKLYPWEWLVQDEFGKNLLAADWDIFEPAWKMVLSNKGILPILWKLFPDHPNLLPAYWDPSQLGNTYVRKPLLSREGANIQVVKDGVATETPGVYNNGDYIYQAFQPLPEFNGNYPVLGTWIVGGASCGMGIREDSTVVTKNTSRFVPHFFTNN